MKKVIEDLAIKNSLTTGYSGTLRIMYVKGENNHEFIQHVKKLYPNLAFQVKPAIAIPVVKQEKVEELKKEVYDKPPTEQKITKQLNAVTFKKSIPQEVDLYLLANPVDRKTKGPYDAAAEHFGVKPDYIRKRWSVLREKKLVEQDNVNT